jgi:hypothetical protein
MDSSLHIGSKIRPRSAIAFGTLGFFCSNANGEVHIATCDHVIKAFATPDEGPWEIYFPYNDPYKNKIAIYTGESLTTKQNPVADLAVAKAILPIENYSKLPAQTPGLSLQNISSIDEPHPGEEVLLWGASSEKYTTGVIIRQKQKYSWPHTKYGRLTFSEQFSLAVNPDYTPQVGDSGGYVITPEGVLIGILAALSGEITDSGVCLVHCVPVAQCLRLLNMQILI